MHHHTARPVLAAAVLGLLVPLAHAQDVHEDAELVTTALTFGARLGTTIVIDGPLAVVGAPDDSATTPASGAVVIYQLDSLGNWVEFGQVLHGTTGSSLQRFGSRLDLSGQRIIVGSPIAFQVVEIFEPTGGGAYVRVAEIYPPDTDVFAWATAVAIDGDLAVLVAGATGSPFLSTGRAYIYERDQFGTWGPVGEFEGVQATQVGLMTFGTDVDIEGERVAVGAAGESGGGPTGSGAVYVAELQTNGAWVVVDHVFDPTPQLSGDFGRCVHLHGDLLFVGAPGAASVAGANVGEVHVFERGVTGTYAHVTTVALASGAAGDYFGQALDVNDAGDRLMVGAPGVDTTAGATGACFLFERRADDTWFESVRFVHEHAAPFEQLGGTSSHSVALSDEFAMLGTPSRYAVDGAVQVLRIGALYHGDTEISLAAGGTHDLLLRGGQDAAGDAYIVLGSFSGSSPGMVIAPGVVLPLVVDAYTNLGLALATQVFPAVGPLGLDGERHAAIVVPPGALPTLAGKTIHHAYVRIDLATFEVGASNAVPLSFVP